MCAVGKRSKERLVDRQDEVVVVGAVIVQYYKATVVCFLTVVAAVQETQSSVEGAAQEDCCTSFLTFGKKHLPHAVLLWRLSNRLCGRIRS